MGVWSFVKNAGKSLFGAAEAAEAPKVEESLKKEIDDLGLDASGLDIKVDGDTVKLGGEAVSQEIKEKVILAMGNVDGIATVEDVAEAAEGATTPDPFIAALAAVIDPDPASMNGVDPAEDTSADETRPNSAIADRLIAQLQAAAQQGIVELQTDPEPEPEPEPMPEPTPPPPGLEPEERNLDSLGDFADRFQQQIQKPSKRATDRCASKRPKARLPSAAAVSRNRKNRKKKSRNSVFPKKA